MFEFLRGKSFTICAILLMIFSHTVKAFEFLDYTQEHFYDCSESDNLTDDQLQDILILHKIDRYLYVIICPITIVATSLIILTFIKYPGTRNPPGDLLLAISCCEFTLNLHWLVSGIYAFANDGESPETNGTFCIFNSVFSIPAGVLDFAYNFVLNWYVSFSLKNSLRGFAPNTLYWHVLMVIGAIISILAMELSHEAGLSIFGTCSYTSNRAGYVFGPLIGFVYLLLGLYMVRQFHKENIANSEGTGSERRKKRLKQFQLKKQQFAIYFQYVLVTSCVYLLLGFANFAIGLNCLYLKNPGLSVFITITNFLKLSSPVILSILRFRDPILRHKILLFLKRKDHDHTQSISKGLLGASSGDRDSIDSNNEQRTSKIRGDMKQFNKYLRQIHLNSMLNGVSQTFSRQPSAWGEDRLASMEGSIQLESIPRPLTKLDFEESEEVILKNDQDDFDESLETLTMRMVIHAPVVFQKLRQKDKNMINFERSMDIRLNELQIKSAEGKGEGGASGEFFFATHDNQLLLKTISSSELKILTRKLSKFIEHFDQESTSLIAKIYGIFSFQQLTSYGTFEHIIVMRNICCIEQKYIERRFDLKGSSFNRMVAANNQGKHLKDMVLKDIDFKEYEQNVKASQQKRSEISQILEFDSNFLNGQGFMDYSIFLLKVDWGKYFRDQPDQTPISKNALEGINQDNFLTQSMRISIPLENKKISVLNSNDSKEITIQAQTQPNHQEGQRLNSQGVGSGSLNSKDQVQRNSARFSPEELERKVKEFFGEQEILQFQSTEDTNIFYHIGIIDYLQQWTVQKSLERLIKNCMTCKNADTSAQPPREYSDRFKNFVRQIFE